ncbi:MAG TPA: Sua5/YciO/YrdC/YwlC family protein, partial [Anaeromyxobacteraceae bacterium]|nr:Sua5/YciO/YrdC/YwlC family protein [Anaeromyxobacteraceae bacterium]
DRPLVMTSGNLAEEPIAFRDSEARERLCEVADLFLVHDREIEARADDSVVRVVLGRPVLLRRSRGYVPRGICVERPFAEPTLACGAALKNCFCLGLEERAYFGPHQGDLENLATLESFEGAVLRLERFLGVRPRLLAHDLHPDYLSTRYALDRARAEGLTAVGVQHHHAHAVSAMAEHGLKGPVLALTWDGTGFGEDGASWGGELLCARYEDYERIATFRPLALAGGDQAIREPWRIALAAVLDAFEGEAPVEALPLFRALSRKELAPVRQMILSGVNAPLAHGVGRVFDAVAALALERPRSRYEGQLPMALEAAADAAERGTYPFALDTGKTPWQIDLRPLFREVASDLVAGRGPGLVSARLHRALGAAGARLVRLAAARFGPLPLVLTGGCFANALLSGALVAELCGDFAIYLPGLVPPGDGGIALGQALVASARARAAAA